MRSGRAGRDDQLGGGELFVRRAHSAARDAKLGCQILPGRQASSRCEHAALDGGPDTLVDLLGQRRLRRSIEFQPQRLVIPLGTRFLCVLGAFLWTREGHLWTKRTHPPGIDHQGAGDEQRLDYNHIAPAGVKALGGVYGYVMQSRLPAGLVNLVYLRVSQINNCAYCLDMHTRDLLKHGVRLKSSRCCRRGRKPVICSTSASAPPSHGPKR